MRWCLLFVLVGCNFSHGQLGTGDSGAGSDATDAPLIDGDVDALRVDAAPPTACVQSWMDGTIRLGSVTELSTIDTTSTERDPFLSADELTIYFYTDRTNTVGGGDVYNATRTSTTQTFSTPVRYASASTDGFDSKMSMTDDKLYLVVASNKNGTGGSNDVLDATRAAATTAFSSPLGRTFTALDDTVADELDPFVTPDGLDLYIAQSINGFQRVVHATRTSRTMTFTAATVIAELDSGVGDADPTVSADGRVILFSSNRTGTGQGGSNIWYATRSSPTGTFGTPAPVPDVNSGSNEGDAWLSHDGCRLYFSSDRNGNYDLWSSVAQ